MKHQCSLYKYIEAGMAASAVLLVRCGAQTATVDILTMTPAVYLHLKEFYNG